MSMHAGMSMHTMQVSVQDSLQESMQVSVQALKAQQLLQ
jgi:hypothetical protein